MNYEPNRLLKTFLRDVTQKNKLNEALDTYLGNQAPIKELKKKNEIPFSSDRKFAACLYDDITLVLGAPEMLLKEREGPMKIVKDYTSESLRVVVFGSAPAKADERNIKEKFKPMLLIAIDDPIREETPGTLRELTNENIQYKIISGDSPDTVLAIAKRINKNYPTTAITGEELDKLEGDKLEKAILFHNVFARIKPNQKQTIIRTFKKNKLFTIMIGDGVNDVLALKESDLGIAMNGGSTMAKDVADVVLVNNSFSTLPLLLFEGRRIITNIQTIANIYLIKNISSIAAIIMLGFIGLRFPFDPKHVELSSLLIIGLPSILLALEKHNFSTTDEGFTKRLLLFSGIVGLVNSLVYTILYTYYDVFSTKLFYSRTILLTSTVFLGVNNIVLIYLQHYKIKEIFKRKIILILLALIVILFFISIKTPFLNEFFGIGEIAPIDFLVSFMVSVIGSMFAAIFLRKLGLI